MNPQKEESGLVGRMLRPRSAGAVAKEAESSAPLPLVEGAPVVAADVEVVVADDVEVVVAAAAEGLAADVAAASPS